MCASTEPAGTGIGAVCVLRSGQTLPKQMLNHTHTHIGTKTRHPTLVRSGEKKTQQKGFALLARAPRYDRNYPFNCESKLLGVY